MTEPKSTSIFNKYLLDELAIRDSATIVGEYTNLNRNSLIEFICRCGTKAKPKRFASIADNYMCCSSCTKKINQEKEILENVDAYLYKNLIFKGHNYWTILNNINQKKYIVLLAIKYNFRKNEDWYKFTQTHINDTNGAGLLTGVYGGSTYLFIKTLIPNYEWVPWLFKQTSKRFWENLDNVKLYCNWLYKKLQYKSLEDWYYVKQDDFRNNNGMGLQSAYNCTLINILKDAYPDYEWLPWKFNITSMGFWIKKENIILFVKYVEKQEHINKISDWYKYNGNVINKHGGVGLLANQYQFSITRLLADIYPEYPFKMYMFPSAPKKYWSDKTNIILYLNDLYEHMKFTSIEDWYKITYDNIINYHGCGLLDKYGGNHKKLIVENIDYVWDVNKFFKKGFSMVSFEWLNYCMIRDKTHIRYKLNCSEGEYKIPKTRYHVDGFGNNNECYEFLGDYYHGNPKLYNSDIYNSFVKKTMGDLYSLTVKRIQKITSLKYKVHIIWEADWKKAKKAVKKIQKRYRRYLLRTLV